MLKRILSVAAAAVTVGCSVVGVRAGTEEPKFELIERIGDLQIRRYGERIAAETEVTGADEQGRSTGFRRLAGYIFGGNVKPGAAADESESIAMTAPVAQAAVGEERWRIQFFMPSRYKLADLPSPRDGAVHLRIAPAETYAVLVFSGSPDAGAMKTKQRELLRELVGTNWRASGEPVNWFYDPPWTLPPLRRNEVAVPVARRPKSTPPSAGVALR
jgi:hypothetical protein